MYFYHFAPAVLYPNFLGLVKLQSLSYQIHGLCPSPYFLGLYYKWKRCLFFIQNRAY